MARISVSLEKLNDLIEHMIWGTQLALPHDFDLPAQRPKFPPMPPIALAVSFKLVLPEISIGSRSHSTISAVMAMPKAAMDEDYFPSAGKHQVWRSRQPSIVQAIPIARGMQHSPNS